MITATTEATTSSPLGHVDGHPTTLRRVLRSEWIKILSLRSTWITAAAILLVIVGFGVVSSLVANGDITPQGGPGPGPGGPASDGGPLSTVLTGANLAVLIVAVMGALIGAREYATGMIRNTFSAVPKRLPVLWSKLVAFASVYLPVVAVGVVAVFFIGMSVLSAGGASTVSWSDGGVARAVLGSAYYIVGLGIIGVAVGILLRSTAAAIGVVLGAILFLPTLASALLPSSWDEVLKYLPSNAENAFTSIGETTGTMLTPGIGAAVFTAWIVIAIAGAAWAMLGRDA
jgi:ABC-type transport system involved in multi-copper enzyme maturation permease subunit